MRSVTTNMRVLHVAPTAFGHEGLFGGGERYPLELARAIARTDGVACELLTFGATPTVVDDDSGVRIRVVKPLTYLRGHPAHPIAPAMLGSLRRFDIVHTHHLRSAPSRIAAVAAKALGRAVVVTDLGLTGGDWFGLLPRLFDRFLTVSRFSAAALDAPPARTRVIYGGTDPARFSADPPAARHGVVYVGRLTPHKGVDRLLAALPSGATLTIAGTGGHDPRPPERDYPEDLRALAAGRDVRFLDAVPEADLPALYRSAAVAAAPSVEVSCYGRRHEISELLGLSAIEAMASATPVVASRVGGLAEVVVDGETGYLVEPGDVEALHDRIRALLDDSALARRMGEAARRRVLELFTWERAAGECVAAYRELLTPGGRRTRRRRPPTPKS